MDEDRELEMMMKLLLGKRQENNTSSGALTLDEEDATFTALLSSGLTLQSFLPTAAASHDNDHPQPPPNPTSSPSLMPLPFSEFAQDTHNNSIPTITSDYFQTQSPILRFPKHEPVSFYENYFSTDSDIFTNTLGPFHHHQFYAMNPPSPLDLNLKYMMPPAISPPITHHHHHHDYDSTIFNNLPDLLPLNPSSISSSNSYSFSSPHKRPRRLFDSHHLYPSSPALPTAQYFQTAMTSSSSYHPFPLFPPYHNNYSPLLLSSASSSSSYGNPPPPPLVKTKRRVKTSTPCKPGFNLPRSNRQTVGDKYRCLQRLLPSNKKMDTTTMLEEAYKYVKFLQAQLAVLQAMPVLTPNSAAPPPAATTFSGGLERLSRNQLLQVLLNSPVAQTVMYSQGCCVFSFEQFSDLSRRFNCTSRFSTTSNHLHHSGHRLFSDSHSPTN